MTETTHEPADEEQPSTDDLEEPSTEKEPDEEPKAPTRNDPEPDHQAVGIGVIGGPQTDTDDGRTPDPGTAADGENMSIAGTVLAGTATCTAGRVAIGFDGKTGTEVDQIGLVCDKVQRSL